MLDEKYEIFMLKMTHFMRETYFFVLGLFYIWSLESLHSLGDVEGSIYIFFYLILNWC